MEISSHTPPQPVFVTIEFKSVNELVDLLVGLKQWTPTGGWSGTSLEFFSGLQEVIDENTE